VVWSDKASFICGRGRVFVMRKPEEKYLQSCCVPKFKDFSCVHVWDCIGGDGSNGPLFIWDRDVHGNICSASYIRYIIPLIQEFKQEHGIFRIGSGTSLLIQDGVIPYSLCYGKKPSTREKSCCFGGRPTLLISIQLRMFGDSQTTEFRAAFQN
jgi:hypothetical protein